jgi:hypothetical protein
LFASVASNHQEVNVRNVSVSSSAVVGSAVVFAMASAVAETSAHPALEVSAAVNHAVSQPVREMPVDRPGIERKREKPILAVPVAPGQEQDDPVVQSLPGLAVNTTLGLNFAGVGNGDYGFAPDAAPPDTNGAVGATQYVQWVNESFAVFDKATGALLKGPVKGNVVFSALGGPCAANNDGDPIAQYDKANNRWILTQFSVSTTPYLQCVAVSQTSDATGAYNLYAFSYGTQFPDYPKVGVWPGAYYISFNIFNNGQTFAGSKLCAYDGAAMRAGTAATQQCFQLSTSFGGVLPPDLDGATPPAAGAPAPFVNFGTNSLNLWRFHADFATPANTALTGPVNIPVAAFTPACGGGVCISQPGTSNRLDSLADRLMYRFAFRNGTTASPGVETAVVNHSVKVSGNKHSQVVGVRWYQLRNLTSGTPAVVQQGTFSPDGNSRWMGSIAMDKAGNIAVGYSTSSASVAPSIGITGRSPTDPPGTLQAETTLLAGTGSQTGNLHRWGDYSAMTIDPVDDCTFFYTTEYLKASGSFNWSTRIASFKFPGCQ